MPNLVWRWAGLLAEVEGSVNHPSKTSTLHPLSILKEAVTTATHVHTSVDELGVFYTIKVVITVMPFCKTQRNT